MTPALFWGALTSIGSRVDRDQGQQLLWGLREWTSCRRICSQRFVSVSVYCNAQRMLLKDEAADVMAIDETGHVEGGV